MNYFPANDMLTLVVSILTSDSKNDVVSNFKTLDLLQAMLDKDSYIEPAAFAPYVVKIIQYLCDYTVQLEQIENKAKVIRIIGIVIVHSGEYIGGMVSPLMSYLRTMWSDDFSQKMINIAVIEVITLLVNVAKVSSVHIHSICLPLIHHSVVSLSKATSFVDEFGERLDDDNVLYEGGLNLWLRISRNTPPENYSGALDSLCNEILTHIFVSGIGNSGIDDVEYDVSEGIVQNICMAVEALAIIGGAVCLNTISAAFAKMIDIYLDNVPVRFQNFILRPIEAFFLRCPVETVSFLVQSGLLTKMVLCCCGNIDELQAVLNEIVADRIIVNNLSIIARILLQFPHALKHSCDAVIEHLRQKNISDASLTSDFLLCALTKLMINNFDTLSDSVISASLWRKKLWSLSLWGLLPSSSGPIISMLPNLLVMTERVINDQLESSDSLHGSHVASQFLAVSLDDADFVDGEMVSIVDEAGKCLASAIAQDIVNTSDLKGIASQKLREMQNFIDEVSFSQLYQTYKAQIDVIMA
jgi:hypothetical protein